MRLIPFDVSHSLVAAEIDSQCFSTEHFSFELLQQFAAFPNVKGHIAHIDNEAVGYVLVRYVAEEAEILTIAVLDAYRRRGFAEKMLKSCFEILQKQAVHKVFLEVRISNIAACKLYEKLGGQKVATRPAYYATTKEAEKEDAFVYCIDI